MTRVAHDSSRDHAPGASTAEGAVRVLVRADSQARSLGEGVVDRGDARLWSAALERRLRAARVDAVVENAGVAGLRIGDAWRGYERDHLVRSAFTGADMVILAVGVNDWWPLARPRAVAHVMERIRPLPLRSGLHRLYQRARPALVRWSNGRFRPTPPGEARRDLERFVAALRQHHEVALVTPLPVSSPRNPGFDGNTIEAAKTVIAVGRAANVPVIDTHELFDPLAWDEISADHVHVNPSGHDTIGQAVDDAVGATVGSMVPDRAERRADHPARVVIRCDLGGFGPAPDVDERWSQRLAAAIDDRLADLGSAPVGVLDGCYRDLDPAYLHHTVLHDPLVAEPIGASAVTVLGVAPASRVGAYTREAYQWLVEVTAGVTRPVLVIPPTSPAGPRALRRFARLATRVGRARGIPVVDLSDLGHPGAVDVSDVAGRLAPAIGSALERRDPDRAPWERS